MVTKLAFLPRDDDPNRAATFFRVADQLLDVAFADGRFVLVVHENARFQRSAAGIAERQHVVPVFRQLLANDDPYPCPRLFRETNLLPLTNTGYFRHLGFQLVVPFTKFRKFSQPVFDPASEVGPVGLSRT